MARAAAVKSAPRSLLSVADFTGGLNTRVSRFLIKDNQAQECENFFFGLGGVLKVRPGAARQNATLGAGGILGGTRYYPATGAAQLLIDHGTTWRFSTDDGVTNTILTLPSGVTLSAFTRSYYVQTADKAYRTDGVNQPLQYDGTTVSKWGIAGPSGAGTGAQAAGGSLTLTSTYKWKITFVTPTAESNGSTTEGSFTLTGANQTINLSSIPTGPAGSGTTKRRIYRTKAGGAIYYRDQEIADNTTTTASMTIADSALGVEMPADKDVPPSDLQYTAFFKNRIIGVKASNLRQIIISELFEPEAWPAANAFTVPFPEGDKIIGLRARGDILFIVGTSTIFAMIGDSPFNFTIRQTFADEGFTSHAGIVEVENVIMGPTRFGFQAFDGANAKVISMEIEPTLRDQVILANVAKDAGVYDVENRIARWSRDVGGSFGSRKEFVFDLLRRGWTTSTRKIAFYFPFRGSPDKGELFSGDPDNGFVWKENQAGGDNGVNITATYKTKTFDMKQPRFFKKFWHVFADFKPSAGTLAIDASGDSGAVTDSFSPNIAGSSSIYGTAVYGVDSYGGPTILSFDEGFTYDPSATRDFVAKYIDFKIQYVGQASPAFEMYRLDSEAEIETWLRKS